MKRNIGMLVAALVLAVLVPSAYAKDSPVLTGWFGGEKVIYLDKGLAKDPVKNGSSDIYLIGGNRIYQANVVSTVPGVQGYNPHWDLNIVHTAPGVTVADILDAGLGSSRFFTEGVLFDDALNVLEAESQGLVRITTPGLIVLCPVVSDNKTPDPETFLSLTEDSTF